VAVQACFGLAFIVFPTAALADHVLGSPLGSAVLVLTGVLAAMGTIPFVTGETSTVRLGPYLGIGVLAGLGWLILVAAGMQLVGMTIEAGDRRPFLYAWLLALATAYPLLYSDAVDVGSVVSSPVRDETSC
jgi:hypothetical protein